MIRIAILDDSDTDRKLMEYVTKRYFAGRGVPCDVRAFSRWQTLFAELSEETYYDIFLLDMELPEKTGLQVAKEIRRHYLEPAIVYVTNYVQYAMEAFEVNAFRYIPKRLLREKLPAAYDVLLPEMEQLDQRSYIVEKESGIERILYRNLFYIRKEGKYVVLFHRGGSSRERKTLKEIYGELNAEEFFYVDKSYVVNVQHVLSCRQGELEMRNGDVLPVSRPRHREVREKIMNYWKGYK